jgi:hypothetical protein
LRLCLNSRGSKRNLDEAFSNIEVGTGKAWEPLRAYTKRLENIVEKSSSACFFHDWHFPGQLLTVVTIESTSKKQKAVNDADDNVLPAVVNGKSPAKGRPRARPTAPQAEEAAPSPTEVEEVDETPFSPEAVQVDEDVVVSPSQQTNNGDRSVAARTPKSTPAHPSQSSSRSRKRKSHLSENEDDDSGGEGDVRDIDVSPTRSLKGSRTLASASQGSTVSVSDIRPRKRVR